jgi:Protein of unknown function (DUF3048) N-terminal domain/Protein of unknown function (DUF3048) C-terminal domain
MRPLALLASVFVTLAMVASCSSDAAEPVAATSTPTPTASAEEPPPPPTTLLSGREGKDHQVLAIKLDNTRNSDPHAGLIAADVIYLEEVEYGLTRYLAVYSSKYPKVIGPVRSARIGDLELMRQYGKIAFAFSGAQRLLLDDIARAFVFPLSADSGKSGYSRDPNRTAPWDLLADPEELLKQAPHARKAKDVGFVFDEEVPAGGKRVKAVTANWPGASARFKWSKSEDKWLLWMDGSPAESTEGPQLGGSTVIVQSVKSYPSQFGDSYGGVTPMSETVGRGKALLLRNGQMWHLTWSRPKAEAGTTWRYKGRKIAMDPGQVWVTLLDDDRKPQVTK